MQKRKTEKTRGWERRQEKNNARRENKRRVRGEEHEREKKNS